MKETKKAHGSVDVCMPREYVNGLVYALEIFEKSDPNSKLTAYANKLRKKILDHGRTYTYKGEEKVIVYFYEQEAAMLIKLLGFYINATDCPKEDYFFSIGKNRKQ